MLIKPFLPVGTEAAYYFYDLNAKVNYIISDNDRVYLSGYMGADVLSTSLTSPGDTTGIGVSWGNSSATARWNHVFSPKLFANTTMVYDDYNFSINEQMNNQGSQDIFANLEYSRDIGGKIDFDWFPSPLNHVKFGATYTYYSEFIPSLVQGPAGSLGFANEQTKYVHNAAVYINDEYTYSEKLSFNFGLRAPYFDYKQTHYFDVEPRFTAKYALNKTTSLKASYAMMYQNIHLLSSTSISLPTDIWIPSSNIVKPEQSQQVSAGIFKNFLDNAFETSAEIYYKKSNNVIEYQPGTNIFFNPDIDNALYFGQGWSYGLELFIKKNVGKFTGWLGYTLSWANLQFDQLNNGEAFPATYDRRHDFSITGIYNFNKSWSFSTVFIYETGSSLTVPLGIYNEPNFNGNIIQILDYGSMNLYKLPPYNRLDIGIKYSKQHKKYEDEWRLDIYNAYSRQNPYFVFIDPYYMDPNANITKASAVQISIFPIIPTISYNFKF